MSVELEPAGQLSFQRPFTNGCTATLTITNCEDATVAFKVKTTAPKQYCVRPNSGTVGPREAIKVQVILQPTTADWPLGYKCKDKFLVQSIKLLQAELDLPLTDLWPAAEKDRKDQLQEHKLRCVYLDPISDSSTSPVAPALAIDHDALDASGNEPKSASASAYNMDSVTDPVVPAPASRVVPVVPASVPMPPSPSKKLADAEPPAYQHQQPLPAASAPAPVDPLQQQLRTAESRIQSLEQQVAQLTNQLAAKTAQLQQHEVTLRQRSTAASTSAAAATQVITKTIVNPNTYSPQLVMIIAILSLLVGAIVF
ncbi:phosphatidylinositol-binding protein scs2 [Allomyces javanicus]|nr:phosphatidylinositol-binding protein scs2 [Allomyces javanicus]